MMEQAVFAHLSEGNKGNIRLKNGRVVQVTSWNVDEKGGFNGTKIRLDGKEYPLIRGPDLLYGPEGIEGPASDLMCVEDSELRKKEIIHVREYER